MPVRCAIRSGAYFDSVVLMRVAADVEARRGVSTTSLMMATAANKEVLAAAGLLAAEAERAGPNDLIIAVDGEAGALDGAIAAADAGLQSRSEASRNDAAAGSGRAPGVRPRTLAEVASNGGLALISTPGRYAGAEALKALRLGMSVLLFSDNVPIEQEVALKHEAHDRGLFVMGPDCGTAILGGVPLGFANEMRVGDIALVGASGTGLQQVCALIDRWGAGVSHVLGVGSRDLSAEVGAISMLDALDALRDEAGTRVVVLVSKPPDASVASAVLDRAAGMGKPVVACFLGAEPDTREDVRIAGTLEAAARMAVMAAGADEPPPEAEPSALSPERATGRRLLRALYSGGTFAYETRLLLEPHLGGLCSDAQPATAGRPPELPGEHLVLDLGDDRFTVGRPHPMIDPTARVEMLRAAGADPRTGVIVLDVVLGHGAAGDPAGALAPAITEITTGEDPAAVVAFVVGTAGDPQGLRAQEGTLRGSGAHLAGSSTSAAMLAQTLLSAGVAA